MSRKTVLFLATSLLLTACSDTSGPDESRLGRYTLRRINGGELPRAVFENAVSQVHFVAGALHLKDDLTFTDSTHVRVVRTREGDTFMTVDVANGTFRLTADTVYLRSIRGEEYHMTFGSSGSLLQDLEGSILLYRK
jgi:hypothetical protein